MERRTEETYVTEALGFPIIIKNVELRRFHDDWVPEVDWDNLQQAVLLAMAQKPAPLSGNEVRFVRHYMGKTLKEFAHHCGLKSHQAVMRWESKEDDPTGMRKSTEIVLRIRILEALPDEVWERIDSCQDSFREHLSSLMSDISQFEKGHQSVPIELLADQDDSKLRIHCS